MDVENTERRSLARPISVLSWDTHVTYLLHKVAK